MHGTSHLRTIDPPGSPTGRSASDAAVLPETHVEVRPSNAAREASQLLEAFALRTGLDGPSAHARRYVWTDACAVMAWIHLHAQSGIARDLARAQKLVEQVHATLARHRVDDGRTGSLSKLSDAEAALRPTAGGLRIGKPLPERRPEEPYNEHLEWDRDGQYFHYNIRWMLALEALARATGDARHLRAAIELAVRCVEAFAHGGGIRGGERLYWKMSIDLSRPLVSSMGHHDALDGLVTLERLRASAGPLGLDASPLEIPIGRLRAMCADGTSWVTGDPLGLGGLLGDISLAVRLSVEEMAPRDPTLERVVVDMLVDAQRGLAAFDAEQAFHGDSRDRLAFRELGLASGLRRCAGLAHLVRGNPGRLGSAAMTGAIVEKLAAIERRMPIATRLEDSWRGALAQATASWQAHRDINEVMLAEALALRGLPPDELE